MRLDIVLSVLCGVRLTSGSFASQDDKWYRWEVKLLRPGTIPPSSKVVERDVSTLYAEYAKVVRWYFEVRTAGNCIEKTTILMP